MLYSVHQFRFHCFLFHKFHKLLLFHLLLLPLADHLLLILFCLFSLYRLHPLLYRFGRNHQALQSLLAFPLLLHHLLLLLLLLLHPLVRQFSLLSLILPVLYWVHQSRFHCFLFHKFHKLLLFHLLLLPLADHLLLILFCLFSLYRLHPLLYRFGRNHQALQSLLAFPLLLHHLLLLLLLLLHLLVRQFSLQSLTPLVLYSEHQFRFHCFPLQN